MNDAIAVTNKQQAIERLKASLESIVTLRDRWIEGKKEELQRAIAAHKELCVARADGTKLRYSRNRVSMLQKVVNALEAGFVPIPRFTSSKVEIDYEDLPLSALAAFNDAQLSGLFDEVRIVNGQRPNVDASRRGRDPLLVGIIKMRGAWVGNGRQWRMLPGRQEHFLLAWWRPEDEIDGDMW